MNLLQLPSFVWHLRNFICGRPHQVHQRESVCQIPWDQAGVQGAPPHSFGSVGADQDQAPGLEEALYLPGGCQGVAARMACG